MSLDDVLFCWKTKGTGPSARATRSLDTMSDFGTPASEGLGLEARGHHLSLNYTSGTAG